MGRRKFRLGIHRKNEERAKHSFIVSIQRTDVVVHVSTLAVTTSELETPVDPSPLTSQRKNLVNLGQDLVILEQDLMYLGHDTRFLTKVTKILTKNFSMTLRF